MLAVAGYCLLGHPLASNRFASGAISSVVLRNVIRGKGSADTLRGNLGSDDLYGGPGHDRIISGIGAEHRVFAGDGEQDLICVDPNSNGVIETADPQDTFIFDRSC
jgi:Ca2+-binding RTX toxin-like protein